MSPPRFSLHYRTKMRTSVPLATALLLCAFASAVSAQSNQGIPAAKHNPCPMANLDDCKEKFCPAEHEFDSSVTVAECRATCDEKCVHMGPEGITNAPAPAPPHTPTAEESGLYTNNSTALYVVLGILGVVFLLPAVFYTCDRLSKRTVLSDCVVRCLGVRARDK